MKIRIRSPYQAPRDIDMGPQNPYIGLRQRTIGAVSLSQAQPVITPGGIDWRQNANRRKRDKNG